MAQATGKKSERWAVGPHLQRGLREVALYLSLALSAFLFLSLVSFHAGDPGWAHMGSNSEIANLGGRFGAWLSDVVLYVFGLMAFVFPLMVGYAGWLYFRGAQEDEENPSRPRFMEREVRGVMTPMEVIPPELLKHRGAWNIALACILIRDKEEIAELAIGEMEGESDMALYGKHNPATHVTAEKDYELAKQFYFSQWQDKDKVVWWNSDRFTKLYHVMQTNATPFYIPLTHQVYGAGLFTVASFINHSCCPNSVCFLLPGKKMIQASRPIKKDEEITVAYMEIPLDVFSTSMSSTCIGRLALQMDVIVTRAMPQTYDKEVDREMEDVTDQDDNGAKEKDEELVIDFNV